MKQAYSVKQVNKETFRLYVAETKSQVEAELSRLVAGLSNLSLYSQIEYAIMSQGKRLRPLMVILSAEAVGSNRSRVMPLAMAFELMHTATLVHDDIIDHDDTRRDRSALHTKWSLNDAILTGDALIALSVDLASRYGQTILKTVAQSALELCEGEHADITFSLESTDEDSYFRRIKEKSASLFQAATYCGAFAGRGTSSEVHALSAFGENFGIAYQLRDDLLDLTQKGNMMPRDLKSARLTLPIIHAYDTGSQQQKKRMDIDLQTIAQTTSKPNSKAVANLLRTINQTGALEYCEKKMDDYLSLAVASVTSLRDTEYRGYLVEMTKILKAMT